MAKAFLYRWFGLGKMKKRVRANLEAEDILFCEEGLRCSVTYESVKGPGYWILYGKRVVVGWLAMTEKRVCAYGGFGRISVNLPYDHAAFEQVSFSIEKPGCLKVKYAMVPFMPKFTGTITLRFRTESAAQFMEQLKRLDVGVKG